MAATLAALDALVAGAGPTASGAVNDRAAVAALTREHLAIVSSTPHVSLHNRSTAATVRLVVVPLSDAGGSAAGTLKLALTDGRLQNISSGQVRVSIVAF
jgi:hypothetical protein